MADLLQEGLQELGIYYLRFTLILLLWYLSRKLSFRVRWVLAILSLVGTIGISLRSSVASELFQAFLLDGILTGCLVFSGIVTADFCEAGFIFSSLLLSPRLLNSSVTVFGPDIYFLIIMTLFLLAPFYTRDSETEEGREVSTTARYLGYILLAADWFLLQIVTDLIYKGYLKAGGTHPILLVAVPDLLIGLALLAGNVLLCRRMSSAIRKLTHLGVKYRVIDKYSFFMMTVTTVASFLLNMVLVLNNIWDDVFSEILTVLLLILLLMQFLFLWTLFRVLQYRESMDALEQKEQQEKVYYENLNQNLKAMAEVRHDIKNVFFTMGSYVNRSDDEEMKEYFWKKIYPFAGESIDRNYIFAQLAQIPSEHIRSFLYMKIMEAVQHHITVKVTVENLSAGDFAAGMDILDLTRILGILMDNAREECERVSDGAIVLTIRRRDRGISYMIQNPLSEQSARAGFIGGGSTKEGHQGLGLQNIRKILSVYENASLNTYHDHTNFIQSLNIRLPEQ